MFYDPLKEDGMIGDWLKGGCDVICDTPGTTRARFCQQS